MQRRLAKPARWAISCIVGESVHGAAQGTAARANKAHRAAVPGTLRDAVPASAESGSKWKQRARKPVPQYTGSTALKPTGSDCKCDGAQPECHSLKPSQKCTSVGHRGSVRGRRSISTHRSRQTVGRSGLPHRM